MNHNLIQFLPYFPPHRGGLESVAEELGKFYAINNFGDVINVTFDVGQEIIPPPAGTHTNEYRPFEKGRLSGIDNENKEFITNKNGKIIGYKRNAYTVYLLPSFDIIPNFPVPKFWKKEFWEILRIINPSREILPGSLMEVKQNEKWIIQTHTRFFLSSLLGGLFAKYHKIKWVHIEHGSDYVILSSKLKNKVSYLYDRLIGKWIFKKADAIVAISEGVKKFVQNEFINREIELIYNGIHFNAGEKKNNSEIIKIGFVGRLVKLKGVDLLIESFINLQKKYPNIELEILGDGGEREFLESISGEKIKFLGSQTREYIANIFLPNIDILVNPSFQEGLPTVVLEGLLAGCVVVATDVGGTKEISEDEDLIIVEKGSVEALEKGMEKAILSYNQVLGKSQISVKKKFDWNENIKKYFSLYNNL